MGSFHCLVHGNLDTSVFRVRSSRKKRSSDKVMREVPSFLTLEVLGDFVADWLPGSNRIQKTLKRAYKALSNDVCLVPVPKLCLWKKGHFSCVVNWLFISNRMIWKRFVEKFLRTKKKSDRTTLQANMVLSGCLNCRRPSGMFRRPSCLETNLFQRPVDAALAWRKRRTTKLVHANDVKVEAANCARPQGASSLRSASVICISITAASMQQI